MNSANKKKSMEYYSIFWCILASVIILLNFAILKVSVEMTIAAIAAICYSILLAFNEKKAIAPFGVLAAVMFGVIAYESKTPMYETFILSIFFYLPIILVDCVLSYKRKQPEFSRLNYFQRNRLLYIAIIIILYSQFVFEIKNYTFMFSMVCSLLTILPIVAMILNLRNYYEQWYVWIAINLVFILAWFMTIEYHTAKDFALLIL